MIEMPGMLMIGAGGRNLGKTEFACRVIREVAGSAEVIGLKVTTVDRSRGRCPRGGDGCGVCSSLDGPFWIREETSRDSSKDTSRLLASSAKQVFWLCSDPDHLAEGLDALLARLPRDAAIVCESNTLRRVVEPGLFVIISENEQAAMKPSAARVRDLADQVVVSDLVSFNPGPEALRWSDGAWSMQLDATAIILAGGKSSRMGRDKALLTLEEQPLIQRTVDRLKPWFKQILVSSCHGERYEFLGLPVIPDRHLDAGPMAGIAAALEHAEHDRCFVVGCDVPELDTGFLRLLLRTARARDVAVPVTKAGQLEPVFAVYSRRIAGTLNQALLSGERRIRKVFPQLDTAYVPLGPHEAWLRDLNCPEDWERFTGRRSPG